MATVEDFLVESRGCSLRLLESLAEPRSEAASRAVTDRLVAGWAQLSQQAVQTAAAFGSESVALASMLRSGARMTVGEGVEPNPQLSRMGECFQGVRDLAETLSLQERTRARDHMLTSLAGAARACAAAHGASTQTAVRRTGYFVDLAAHAESERAMIPLNLLTEESLRGVPDTTELSRALHRWSRVASEWLTPSRVAQSSAAADRFAQDAAVLSAAARRACLGSSSRAMQDQAQRWATTARAWSAAAQEWLKPPPVVSGNPRVSPEVFHASAALRSAITGEFHDVHGRWVTPERLASPNSLRVFEYAARENMQRLGQAYSTSVSSASVSEVMAMPARALSRSADGRGVSAQLRLGSRDWVLMPSQDPAALRLRDSAVAVEVACLRLGRPGPLTPHDPRPGQLRATGRSRDVASTAFRSAPRDDRGRD